MLDSRKRQSGEIMWWGIGFGGLLYLVLLITLGVMTLRNGHGWMFFFGIFLPIFWIIGAVMRPTPVGAA
jgi:hypothetical protein